MKFIDLFAGIGGFRRGMELAGHECVGFCEWDKFATASYTSMHLITEEQREYLATLDLKKRQKEILKEEYRNGEWYANDIRNVDARSIPQADCWCFGAPCQDFSIAGKRAGLEGDRSSLVREVFRILGEIEEESRPEWFIYENVKGMFSSNRGFDFLEILLAMDELGYDVEWQLFNSKDWGVPQNRERVYTVGHLRRCGTRKILPLTGANGENSIQQLGNYLLTKTRNNPNQGHVYSADGIAPCLNKMDGGGREPSVVIQINEDILLPGKNYNQRNVIHPADGISRTLISSSGNEPKVAIPVLTPDRANKGQDRHGVGISIYDMHNNTIKKDGICGTLTSNGNTSTTHCGSFGVMYPVIVDDKEEKGIYVQLFDDLTVYAIWYEKYQCYIAIRKLTPKECFRLQGWTDDYFEKAQFVNSDSQLYKQAGNGVTVNVVYAIGRAMTELEVIRD